MSLLSLSLSLEAIPSHIFYSVSQTPTFPLLKSVKLSMLICHPPPNRDAGRKRDDWEHFLNHAIDSSNFEAIYKSNSHIFLLKSFLDHQYSQHKLTSTNQSKMPNLRLGCVEPKQNLGRCRVDLPCFSIFLTHPLHSPLSPPPDPSLQTSQLKPPMVPFNSTNT